MAVRKNKEEEIIKDTAEVEQKEVKKKPEQPKKFDRNELVEIRNNTGGLLVVPSMSPDYNYVLNYHGDTDTLEYRELEHVRNRHPLFFQNGWLEVLDPEAVKSLRVDRFYKNLMTEEEIEDFFASDIDTMEQIIDQASPQNIVMIVNIARDKVRTGELDSNSKIRFLEQRFENHGLKLSAD